MSDLNETRTRNSRAEIARVAERQLGTAAPQPTAFEDGSLIRFSANLKARFTDEERKSLEDRAAALAPWLQGPFLLGDDLVIGGAWRADTRWNWLSREIPDLTGKRVLDVGSNAGYDPFRFSLLDPGEVVACEPFAFINQMRFLEGIYQSGIKIREVAWQGLDPGAMGRFDLVHCHGVLYHEPDPVGLLQRLYEMTADGGLLLFGSMMHADPERADMSRMVPAAYYGDDSWWWTPGPVAMRRMIESVGFEVEKTFGVSPGASGEFPTVNGNFRAIRPA